MLFIQSTIRTRTEVQNIHIHSQRKRSNIHENGPSRIACQPVVTKWDSLRKQAADHTKIATNFKIDLRYL